jgi:cyclophilin family peptidyl-prolyl cis-trans isomerase
MAAPVRAACATPVLCGGSFVADFRADDVRGDGIELTALRALEPRFGPQPPYGLHTMPMATHKAPTAVSLAPTSEKSGLALFVDRYWKLAALIAVVAAGTILWIESRKLSRRSAQSKGWEELLAVASPDPMGGLTGVPSDVKTVAERIKDTDAGAWGLYIAANSALDKREFEVAKQAVQQIRADFPEHALVRNKVAVDPKGATSSVLDALDARIDAQRAWMQSHATLYSNPPPPADAPRVRLTTDRGAIVVQLYPDAAPKHVENFLKLVREGYYNGTKFHAVRRGSYIAGGDPNSKEADTSKWGLGGPEQQIDREESPLAHFAGTLSMWKSPGSGPSNGSQFLITTADDHSLDSTYVPFGKVVEGMDVVLKLDAATTAAGTERPEDPATIQSAEVL